jgi:hypothetical protein
MHPKKPGIPVFLKAIECLPNVRYTIIRGDNEMKALTTKAIFQAHAGAQKMTREGYRYERSNYWEHLATITNPEGTRYSVGLSRPGRRCWCACPFHAENGICKHTIWASEQVDREYLEVAGLEERAAAERVAEDEYLDALEQGWSR